MSVLTGVLLDVSGYMEQSVGDGVKEKGGSWAKSIFKVVDDLIKNDVSESNHVFALGVGGSGGTAVFDMLNTLNRAKPSANPMCSRGSKREILEKALTILERKGAPRVRGWAEMSILLDVVMYEEAVMILDRLQHDPIFTRRFVEECLPDKCKKCGLSDDMVLVGFSALNFVGIPAQELATKDSVKEAVRKGMALGNECALVKVGEQAAVMEAQKALEILRGCVGEQQLTDERVDKLMETVRPFIFGGTPLIEALGRVRDLFSLQQYSDHHKLLFVLSDGQPTDCGTPPLRALAGLGVTIVSCFITHQSISEPLRLYSTERLEWNDPAKFMFRMSTTIATQQIPRTVFVKRGWQIDTENNETRLFCQVNHPDIISDVCDLARNVVCCQDALSDILATVSLDIYINEANQGFGAKEQVGGTCYANATAAALHLAMKRVVGRDGGYPDFFYIRDDLIKRYGTDGANTFEVLQEVCPHYRLQCNKVDVAGALRAVTAKRPVIARFRLTDNEWESFKDFYETHKKGILTRKDIDISKRPSNAILSGHAVVLTSFDSQGLRLMNSWGSNWADGGFFRVQNANILRLEFVDVFWTVNDLRQSEKDAYAREGPRIAAKLMSSLKGLQSAQYRCPLCHMGSKVMCFSGHLLQATCPLCQGSFKPEDSADDLALNLYLTSLCG
ncbi:hypothetical protein ACEWY4_011274 [Coilia grayii]|uniref:Uncharacterized protein n=1 Tax=Coilia grayii TaxID=363190 RepID=A0ABD1K4B5_9TELE